MTGEELFNIAQGVTGAYRYADPQPNPALQSLAKRPTVWADLDKTVQIQWNEIASRVTARFQK